MDISLAGKVAIVTGGARGIGLATALALTRLGSRVAIGDIDQPVLDQAASSQQVAFHGRLDVTNPADFRSFVDDVETALGPIDILINNAGIMPIGHLYDESEETARRMFEINVFGVITGTKRALDTMRPRDRGHIVNVASLAGVTYAAGAATYCGTKHAVVGFTEATRYEYAHTGIEFTTILPAFVNTELTAGTQGLPLLKTVEPEDVAEAIVAVLQKPRARVFVPTYAGAIVRSQSFVPRRVGEFLTDKLGGDTAFLDDVDQTSRAAYEDRARHS